MDDHADVSLIVVEYDCVPQILVLRPTTFHETTPGILADQDHSDKFGTMRPACYQVTSTLDMTALGSNFA